MWKMRNIRRIADEHRPDLTVTALYIGIREEMQDVYSYTNI